MAHALVLANDNGSRELLPPAGEPVPTHIEDHIGFDIHSFMESRRFGEDTRMFERFMAGTAAARAFVGRIAAQCPTGEIPGTGRTIWDYVADVVAQVHPIAPTLGDLERIAHDVRCIVSLRISDPSHRFVAHREMDGVTLQMAICEDELTAVISDDHVLTRIDMRIDEEGIYTVV